MAYSERLAERVRDVLIDRKDVEERRMFGGLVFMIRRHMCCGIEGDRLMGRVGPQQYEQALRRKYTSPMDFTGRPLSGFVYVAPAGLKTRRQLQSWVTLCLDFVHALPVKKPAKAPSNRTNPIARRRTR